MVKPSKELINILNNQEIAGNVSLRLFDINGKIIAEEKGILQNIRSTFLENSKKIPKGVYLIQLISEDGNKSLS